jgi:hypothetical protein
MVATRAVKRAVVDSRNPLQHQGLREHIFSFVGAGHWWFVAQVSRAWKLSYQSVENCKMQDHFAVQDYFICTANMTLTQAAFATVACCSLATDPYINGGLCLDNSDWFLQQIAGQFSDLETLRLALERGLLADDCVMRGAAESGSLSKVRWLHESRQCPLPTSLGACAAYSGSLELLTWLTEQGCKLDKHACTMAAVAGHKHILCYLREQDCDWDARAVAAAAANNHLSLVKWLLSAGCPFEAPSMCEGAAESGRIEMMVYARQLGCELNARVMQVAADNGRLPMCQYLHSEECAWDTEAPKWAAFSGHIDMLRWLREQGCPWIDVEVCTMAVKSGHTEVMHFLLYDLALATPELLHEMLDTAGVEKQLVAAQWLRQQGAEWPADLYEWSEECLAWARQQGCTAPGDDDDEHDFIDDDMQ